ncbi:MAG: dATP/dGTP diphosphohydrolase domain-containing protein [Candidatus Dormibacteria bacterium]
MLAMPTADGGGKRERSEKPSWKVDISHEAAMFSHLNKWKHGESVDPDSGAHPLVHLAWRALAIAARESGLV